MKKLNISTNDTTYYKCRKCGDEIFWNTHKRLIWCSCQSLGVDGCEDYTRLLGNEVDMEVISKDSL